MLTEPWPGLLSWRCATDGHAKCGGIVTHPRSNGNVALRPCACTTCGHDVTASELWDAAARIEAREVVS